MEKIKIHSRALPIGLMGFFADFAIKLFLSWIGILEPTHTEIEQHEINPALKDDDDVLMSELGFSGVRTASQRRCENSNTKSRNAFTNFGTESNSNKNIGRGECHYPRHRWLVHASTRTLGSYTKKDEFIIRNYKRA